MCAFRSPYTCPSCHREVLNRRVAKCLFCEAELPASMLLPAAAAAAASVATVGALTAANSYATPIAQEEESEEKTITDRLSEVVEAMDVVDMVELAGDAVKFTADAAGSIISDVANFFSN